MKLSSSMMGRLGAISKLIIGYLMLIGSTCTFASAEPAANGYTLLVMGDSIGAAYGVATDRGWVALLQRRLEGRGFEIINASISGETTAGGLRRLPDLLESKQPDLVIIELGGNDGLRGLPVKQMYDNLAGMIKQSLDSRARVLLLGMRIPPNYGPAYSDAFAGVYQRLAKDFDVSLESFFLEPVALDFNLMQNDGIHPTAEAQPLLLEHIWPSIQLMLPASPSFEPGSNQKPTGNNSS
ncbi:MAG: esterase TesA [marine bacterium B5-7]|nr:MAG: esterase TesA [marine bacterium B5-7]